MIRYAVSALLILGFNQFAVAKKSAAPTKSGATVMKIDTAKSEIGWTGKKVMVQSAHNGTLALKSGELQMDGEKIKGGKFEIDMASLKNVDLAGNPKQADLEGHLKSPDFFDVAKYPTSTFTITSVKELPKAAGQPTHEITGDLKMKAAKKSVTFPATITATGDSMEAVADLKIDRTKWDVRYGSDSFFKGLGDKAIANDVELKLKLTATK